MRSALLLLAVTASITLASPRQEISLAPVSSPRLPQVAKPPKPVKLTSAPKPKKAPLKPAKKQKRPYHACETLGCNSSRAVVGTFSWDRLWASRMCKNCAKSTTQATQRWHPQHRPAHPSVRGTDVGCARSQPQQQVHCLHTRCKLRAARCRPPRLATCTRCLDL